MAGISHIRSIDSPVNASVRIGDDVFINDGPMYGAATISVAGSLVLSGQWVLRQYQNNTTEQVLSLERNTIGPFSAPEKVAPEGAGDNEAEEIDTPAGSPKRKASTAVVEAATSRKKSKVSRASSRLEDRNQKMDEKAPIDQPEEEQGQAAPQDDPDGSSEALSDLDGMDADEKAYEESTRAEENPDEAQQEVQQDILQEPQQGLQPEVQQDVLQTPLPDLSNRPRRADPNTKPSYTAASRRPEVRSKNDGDHMGGLLFEKGPAIGTPKPRQRSSIPGEKPSDSELGDRLGNVIEIAGKQNSAKQRISSATGMDTGVKRRLLQGVSGPEGEERSDTGADQNDNQVFPQKDPQRKVRRRKVAAPELGNEDDLAAEDDELDATAPRKAAVKPSGDRPRKKSNVRVDSEDEIVGDEPSRLNAVPKPKKGKLAKQRMVGKKQKEAGSPGDYVANKSQKKGKK
ncbi:hypothetical protein CLAFUW4_00831 [Fulvia fulva]|uniref:Uncharacterized protein n=1 Tax=Passalora fulva TaxID=5499 RepID=A0A9Q8L7E6_PASFU|nr:uncharacterized protein CLAFUR5_00834 [Fulvia fulva]KAK4635274.1 hypothetical protein CLAFUR4_00832 [Fulvia fulva]KAK4638080.1 hypothetical protein CLAFUR0_00832 [Fulvia fulva]UJO12190.1 hypothetical protein CLAFUR5_00834 [Fulvia fulva]WPV09081.1 hypothetical protein CLAFUW4_00831 [Fulvia fulva]WPV23082.1 hypothetical protein CLAFUW7_00985 [Fulvia fulva]